MLGTRFVGGRGTAPLVASGLLAGRVNYLIGKNPSRWHTGVPTYATVSYRGEWPGIDVPFHGNQSQLEYDFLLKPRADAGQIALRLSGARRLSFDPKGNVLVGLRGGSLRVLAPRAYQTIDSAHRAVSSRYVIAPGGEIGIRLGAYDHARALVIDPTVPYSTYLGGGQSSDFGPRA